MLDSRVKAREGEVGTIKALALSEDEKRCQEHCEKLIKRVPRAKRMDGAAQKGGVMKRNQLIIHAQNLQRFED